ALLGRPPSGLLLAPPGHDQDDHDRRGGERHGRREQRDQPARAASRGRRLRAGVGAVERLDRTLKAHAALLTPVPPTVPATRQRNQGRRA
ncbi:hypothetical protein, partial [Actinomadura luteofluorescens]